ncbi:unnamed protein product [Cylindrotheca closterium]|uniref:Uncharacterized protein n=1 Tax=Cylindrotheca closterium TaxID=2856 RepID=A0AAD2FDG5_9STRA|nr:unnamed protein product [Cylindrotheca closterium]
MQRFPPGQSVEVELESQPFKDQSNEHEQWSNANGPIYKACLQDTKIRASKRALIAWWQASGKNAYRKALNSKRQTLSNTLKGLVIGMFMNPERVQPPEPSMVYSVGAEGNIAGLRENTDIYILFLKNFMRAIYGQKFTALSMKKTISGFVPECLEAFLVLAYDNGYEAWKAEAEKKLAEAEASGGIGTNNGNDSPDARRLEGDSDSPGSDSSESHVPLAAQECRIVGDFKFTGSGRGSRKAEGWSEEGYTLFNKLFSRIKEQRADETLGLQFETTFILNAEEVAPAPADQVVIQNNWADLAVYGV